VQDPYSRQIVGWSMATHMRATLVVDALQMALGRRRPAPGLIHHSDQAANTSASRSGALRGRPGSRSRWAHAGTPTTTRDVLRDAQEELVNRRSWPSRLELQSAVFECIEAFCNRQRRHSTLGMVSPAEYEQTQTTATSIKIKQPTT